MSYFLKAQFDYIYFFYGLGFFFLAIVCFIIRKDQSYGLRWELLGLFGLTHGLNEWADIYEISYGPHAVFSIAHLVVLAVSYLCLFEFARTALLLKGKEAISPKAYILLLLLASLGSRHGLAGLNVTLRYFLGFPAGVLSALAIVHSSRKDPSRRRPLLVLSATLAGYSFLSGLIVPQVDFNPARWLNSDAFFQLVGMPVQLFRGILAILSSMALWFYHPRIFPERVSPQIKLLVFKPSKWTVLLTLVALVGFGWVFTNYLDYYGGVQLIKNYTAGGSSPLSQVVKELARLEEAAITMSVAEPARNALLGQTAAGLAEFKALIELHKARFDNLDILLLDAEGKVVFALEQYPEQHLDAKSYAYAAYFQKAMSGKTGYSFELGMAYNKRNYYVSYPVKAKTGKIIGAVVLRKSLSAVPIIHYRLISIVVTMFVCLLTIMFFTSLRKREDLIAFVEDVNKQLMALDGLKTDFLAIVSHELRTPLTSIKSATALLLRNCQNRQISKEQERELLEIIRNNTDRQTRMINDLLDVSKIEAGVMSVRPEATDMVALAKDAVKTFQDVAAEKKVKLNFCAGAETAMTMIDPEQTRRIFTNLIDNAIKFTPEGGAVTVKIEETDAEVTASVADTGIGISEAEQKKIFNKFYRSDDAAVRQRSGSGLGLLIIKGLVDIQGGRIWVESSLNRGSTFYFSFFSKSNQKGDEHAIPHTDH